MEFIKDYMFDSERRAMLNSLTRTTFGFDFEDWFAAGFCRPGGYVPYSFVENGKMLSNVSANPIAFALDGKRIDCIQIGTVMTDAAHRRKGLAARLMERLIEDYSSVAPEIYLFANDSAVGFYEKIGFVGEDEYRWYVPSWTLRGAPSFVPAGQERFLDYRGVCREMAHNSAFPMLDGFNLTMFYTADMENLFYSAPLECYALYEVKEGELSLSAVISRRELPLAEVISAIPKNFESVKLGFTPRTEDMPLFEARRYHEPDSNLMHLPGGLSYIKEHRLFFPVLSHT